MGTLSHLYKEAKKLGQEGLRPGTPIEMRSKEMELLFPIAPDLTCVKRGCVPNTKGGLGKILVRVVNGSYHDLEISEIGSEVITTHNGARLHIKTVEEFHEYTLGLCSPEAIPKAGA